MSEPFIGQITLYAFGFAPKDWADCQGQLLPVSQNTALFSLLGTAFGGDGVRSFALPDLQGRVAIGQGTLLGGSTYSVGENGGVETVPIATGSMATHNHGLAASTNPGSTNSPGGAVLAAILGGTLQGRDHGKIYSTGTLDTALVPGSVVPLGGGQPHANLQPTLTLRYCIALNGMFPQRP